MNDEKYKWYLDRVKENREIAINLDQRIDQLIFALASGTIVFSVTFIDKITGIANICYINLLRLSWVFLFVSLILNLLTFVIGTINTRKYKKDLDEWYKNGKTEFINKLTLFDNLQDWVHYLSILFLLSGLGLMVYFTQLNIITIIK